MKILNEIHSIAVGVAAALGTLGAIGELLGDWPTAAHIFTLTVGVAGFAARGLSAGIDAYRQDQSR